MVWKLNPRRVAQEYICSAWHESTSGEARRSPGADRCDSRRRLLEPAGRRSLLRECESRRLPPSPRDACHDRTGSDDGVARRDCVVPLVGQRDRHARRSRRSDAFWTDYRDRERYPRSQRVDLHLCGRSGVTVSERTSSSAPLIDQYTLGRNEGCSSITELLRNFCTKQSFPWMVA